MKRKCVKIEKWEKDETEGLLVLRKYEVVKTLNNEFNDLCQERTGTQIILTAFEMEESEYQGLPVLSIILNKEKIK